LRTLNYVQVKPATVISTNQVEHELKTTLRITHLQNQLMEANIKTRELEGRMPRHRAGW
jgi:hypothetical protein